MVLVLSDDIAEAAWHWQEVDKSPECESNFRSFLDVEIKQVIFGSAWAMEVSQQTGDRLALLMGPHYRAIIKIYLAKKQRAEKCRV